MSCTTSDSIGTPLACTDLDPEDLRCPRCEYNVRGLEQPRCPECGQTFDPQRVVARAQAQSSGLFEFYFFDRPISTFLRTLRASVRPRRFWGAMHRRWPTQAWGLWFYLAFVLGLTWSITVTGYIGTNFGINCLNRVRRGQDGWAQASRDTLNITLTRYPEEFVGGWIALPGFLAVAGFLPAPLIFWQTLRRHRVSRTRVLRVIAYASWPVLAWAVTFQFLFLVGNPVRINAQGGFGGMGVATAFYWGRRAATVVFPILFLYGLETGLRRHLGIRRGWMIVLTCVGLTVLGAWTALAYDTAWPITDFGPGHIMIRRLPALLWPIVPH